MWFKKIAKGKIYKLIVKFAKESYKNNNYT